MIGAEVLYMSMASEDDILDLDLETLTLPSHSSRDTGYRRKSSDFGSRSGLENEETSLDNIFGTSNTEQVGRSRSKDCCIQQVIKNIY